MVVPVVVVGLKNEELSFLLTCENMHTQSVQIMLTQCQIVCWCVRHDCMCWHDS